MSSRALRKAQREKEEQDRLKQLEEEARALEEDEESDEDVRAPAPKKSAFAMLQEEDEDEDEPAEEAEDDSIADTPAATPAPKTSAKKKKKKKKAKVAVEEKEELDEIDAALKALSTNGNSSQSAATNAGVDQTINEACRLLAIDTNHLHAQNELKRLFGRAALQQDDEEQPAPEAMGGNRRQQRQQVGLAQALRRQQNGGRSGLSGLALRRNVFIQGKEDWPAATGGGLGMEVEEKRADGTVLYRYVHNIAYRDVQSQFETCVESMDPNRMINLLQMNPYHISTLLQVSEIAKQDRTHNVAGDLLERALFSFGRAVHSTFAKNLAEGKARLDFRRAENREFWLASWRYMQHLTMRATWRTVYEWTKLLLSLSPEEDPYALWLTLDQYALRSRQDLDYLNISRNPTFKAVHQDMPNVLLSQGLAEIRAGNKGKGKQALFTAIGKFPWVIARLMQELNVDPPPAIWGKEPRTAKEKLYTELYATRAKDLWNTPETTSLLVEIASALPTEAPAAPINADEITRNEARHVLLSDTPALIALIPRNFTAQMESASDPLPPDDAYDSYLPSRDSPHQQPADTMTDLRDLQNWFRDLIPALNVPGAFRRAGDGAADEDEGEMEVPDIHELMRQIRNEGVDPRVFFERAQRLRQLEEQPAGVDEEGEAEGDGVPPPPHQARVEDVEDAG